MSEIVIFRQQSSTHDGRRASYSKNAPEFVGWSMGEISVRRGFITDTDVGAENAVIRGRLPKSQYTALADALAAATRDLARLEQV